MDKHSREIFLNRRELLRWAGLAMAAGIAGEHIGGPLSLRAAAKVNPLGTARNAIMIEMSGAISPMDCWDFKETKWTPKDLEPQRVWPDLQLSKTFFPKLVESKVLDRISFVRSMRAKELVHFNAWYHLQAGRALNVSIAKEVPAFGTVVASELDSQRRDSDTFPTYMSANLTRNRVGAIGSGFFPARFSGLDLDAPLVFGTFGEKKDGDSDLQRRWEELRRLSEVNIDAPTGDKGAEFQASYDYAYRILRDPRWAAMFQVSDAETQKYGSGTFGRSCLLAKNILKADAGTRFIYVSMSNGGNGPFDHHTDIYDRTKRSNHYVECALWDQGFTALVEDLAATPGKAPGKSLLDETLILSTSEFGRLPYVNQGKGRDHWNNTFTSLYVGGGVKGRRIIGKTNEDCSECIDVGWKNRDQPIIENAVATIYSALGIDWTKHVTNTPSGRAYEYIQSAPLGESNFVATDPFDELFV
jgi:hypothetical protein